MALKAKLAIKARVKRGGNWVMPLDKDPASGMPTACAWAISCGPMRSFWTTAKSPCTKRH